MSVRYGPPEVVCVVDDEPEPEVGADDVLVRVHATTVNRTDCGYRARRRSSSAAISGLRRPGRASGARSTPGSSSGSAARSPGSRPVTRSSGMPRGGSARTPSRRVSSVPRSSPPCPTASTCPPPRRRPRVATTRCRASGAPGSSRGSGCSSTARPARSGRRRSSCSSTSGCTSSRPRPPRTSSWCAGSARSGSSTTRRGLHPHGEAVDAVLDMVGKSTFGACRRILRPGGVYVSSDLGPFAQNIALPLVTRVGRGRRVVFPFPMETPEVLEHLRSRLESGAFRPGARPHLPARGHRRGLPLRRERAEGRQRRHRRPRLTARVGPG